MKSKYKGRKVTYDQECRIVRMYQAGRLIKDIAEVVRLNRQTVTNVLEAHGVKRVYAPAEGKKKAQEIAKGTIIQQCVAGINERHKRLTELFKPTMTA